MTPPDAYEEFAAFARACQPRLLRAAFLICGDVHLAEDLLQTTLVKVALRWSRLRNGQPEAYARTVLYRDAISWWRRQRREITVATPPEPARADLTPTDPGIDDVPLRLIFAQALARLTPKQRAVLVLRFFEDHTEARTAEVLGVSVGTVKSQTAVALRRLRELAPELLADSAPASYAGLPADSAPASYAELSDLDKAPDGPRSGSEGSGR